MFKRNNRGIKLSPQQDEIKNTLLNNLRDGTYKELENPCICGAKKDVLIATEDRYGIPIKTVICKNCGLIRCNPYLDEESLSDFYTKYYRALYASPNCSKEYFDNRTTFANHIIDKIRAYKEISYNNLKVFEIGCSGGGILQAFKNKGCEVYGCDYNKNWIEFGRSQGLTLEIGSYDNLKKYGKADIIVLSHVLEHILSPVTFLKNIKDLLKDDGIILIILPIIETIQNNYNNDIFLYLQNAHVWNFSIETFNFVAKYSGYNTEFNNKEDGIFILKKSNTSGNVLDCDNSYYKKNYNMLKNYEKIYQNKIKESRKKQILEKLLSKSEYNDINGQKHEQIKIFGIKITYKKGKKND